MAEEQRNNADSLGCTLCDKFVRILRPKAEGDVDDETEMKCDDCGSDDPVVALCTTSAQYLCGLCKSYHLRKKHDIVPVQPMEKALYCPLHKKELDHYCETCDKVICHYCVTKDHVGHTFDTVESTASKHRDELTKLIAPVDEMITNLTKSKREIVFMKGKIDNQASEIEKMIDECLADQVAKLNQQHQQLKKQLLGELSQKEEALTMQLEGIQSVQDELEMMKKQRDDLAFTPARRVLLLNKKEDIEKSMQGVSDKYQSLNTLPIEADSIEFVPVSNPELLLGHLFTSAHPYASEVVDLPLNISYNTKVDVAIQTRNCKGENCTKGGHFVSAELKSATGNVTTLEVKDNKDGSYVASFVAVEVGEAELSVSIYGQQIRGSPYSIVVGRNYQGIDMPDEIIYDNNLKSPWGVAFSNDGKWVLVDHSGHGVCIFNEQNELVKRFGGNGGSSGQFANPRGVAFDNENHFYVADSSNNRVQKFSIKGNYLLQFGNDSDCRLNSPHSITIHNYEAYVADFKNHRIAVFQTNGQFCTHFGKEHLGGPIDVAVNTYNHLLVLDHHNHCVVTFTLDGYHIGKFGTQGTGWGELHYPYSIVIDVNGCILIADQSNNRVAIFDKYGIYIDSFGSGGSKPGQFSVPRSIALSPNGSIYVSEGGNKRVQIFSSY